MWREEVSVDNATPRNSQTGYKLLIYVNIAFESIYLTMECQVITMVSQGLLLLLISQSNTVNPERPQNNIYAARGGWRGSVVKHEVFEL